MIIGLLQSILTAVFVGAFYAMDTAYIHKFDRIREGEGSGRSYSYTLLVLGMVLVLVIQPVMLPLLSLVVPDSWGLVIQIAGMALIFGAFGLHIWARRHLRQFYAERVEVQPNHQLIQSGPYSTIRHPVITSFFMFATGLLLINPSLPTLLAAGFTFWDFSRAARKEENLLSNELAGYKEYVARTRSFFPAFDRLIGGKSREH